MLKKSFYRSGPIATVDQMASFAAKATFEATTLMTSTSQHGFGEIRDWSKTQGIVLFVCFLDAQGRAEVHGSAVMVGPGVALCAWHILSDCIELLVEGEKELYCYATVGTTMRAWQVHEVTDVPDTDLAILGMELRSLDQQETVLSQSLVSAVCPSVGDALTAVGTIATEEHFLPDKETQITVELRPKWSTGLVVDAFLEGTGTRPFPHLWVELASFGGMSGGPVFNREGFLIGIVSKSFSQLGSDDGRPTLVSLIFPALVFPFKGGWPNSQDRTRTLLEDPAFVLHGREQVAQAYDLFSGKVAWLWKVK